MFYNFLYRARLKTGWEVWELTCIFECKCEMYPPKLRFPPLKIFKLPEQTFHESSVHLIGAYPPAVFQNGILRVFPSCVSKRMPAGVQWTFRKCSFDFVAEFEFFDMSVFFNSVIAISRRRRLRFRCVSYHARGFIYNTLSILGMENKVDVPMLRE